MKLDPKTVAWCAGRLRAVARSRRREARRCLTAARADAGEAVEHAEAAVRFLMGADAIDDAAWALEHYAEERP